MNQDLRMRNLGGSEKRDGVEAVVQREGIDSC